MVIDLTTVVTQEIMKYAYEVNPAKASFGHLGTHFDVMNKKFPIEFTEREGIIFDISNISDRDIEVNDIDLDLVKKDMFVAFYSGLIDRIPYGTEKYFSNHPQLSEQLIDKLLEKEVSIIGVDFAGVRRGKEHQKMDQYCADRGVFIVENLCNLKNLIDLGNKKIIINTYPINFEGMSGLPCRVVAKLN